MNKKDISPTLQTAIDWLIYKSYEHNRKLDPERSIESWEKIYREAETYEEIYQKKMGEKNE
jgi:hypothetical protein